MLGMTFLSGDRWAPRRHAPTWRGDSDGQAIRSGVQSGWDEASAEAESPFEIATRRGPRPPFLFTAIAGLPRGSRGW